MATLFSPISFRDVNLKNRIVMSPMCMYSSDSEGRVTNWHLIHYASRAVGQAGLIVLEATGVTPQGRISPKDLGIWEDAHTEGLAALVKLIHENGSKAAIQLAHAGRKSTVEGPIVSSSGIPFDNGSKVPEVLNISGIEEIIDAFAQAARRAKEAGFDIIEIHGAHGYLINQFLSPLINQRTDAFGGGREARYEFLRRVTDAVKQQWDGPLFVRLSADEYHEQGNTIEDILYFTAELKKQGVDLIDVSTGGVIPVSVSASPGYQVPYAEKIRRQTGIATGAVGLITTGPQAEEILNKEQADLIFIGRELLRDPYWPRTAAKKLNAYFTPPRQYERGW